MALSDFADPYADIPAGNTTIRVYALNLEAFGQLHEKHGQPFLDALASYKHLFGSGDAKAVEYTIVALICQMSDLMADVIALGAREPNQSEIAKRLPVDVQIAAATQVCCLTVQSGALATTATDLQILLRAFGPTAGRLAH